jgi:hypothetical protein
MPSVLVKERKRVTLVKAPFRAIGFVVGGTGAVTQAVGHGLVRVGTAIKMGKRSEWVPEADTTVRNGRVVKVDRDSFEDGEIKKGIKIFDKNGQRAWKDGDSLASTDAGSIMDEKVGKEFC